MFRKRVLWIEQDLGVNADDLMACMAFESGGTFSAKVHSPVSSATGLIQFMNQTAVDLGTTTAKLAAMKDEDQLNYVWKYFKGQIDHHGPLKNLEDVYMAILWPAAIGKPLDYPLFVNDISRLRDSYDVNKGLDANKDGKITKAEAAARPREKLVEGMKPENMA